MSGISLLAAGASARRSALALVADRPALQLVRTDLVDLHGDLARLATRLEGRSGGAGAGTLDR